MYPVLILVAVVSLVRVGHGAGVGRVAGWLQEVFCLLYSYLVNCMYNCNLWRSLFLMFLLSFKFCMLWTELNLDMLSIRKGLILHHGS